MELKSIAQVMEIHATLKLGTDFGVEALMPDMLTGGALQYLDHNVTDVIAKKHGFDKCCWSGHFSPEDGTVAVVLRKEIEYAQDMLGQIRRATANAESMEQWTLEHRVIDIYVEILRSPSRTISTEQRIALLNSLGKSEAYQMNKPLANAHREAMSRLKGHF